MYGDVPSDVINVYQPPGTDICITFKSPLMRGRFKLLCFLATDRVLLGRSVWASALGVGLCSQSLLSPDVASSAQPNLDISTVYMKSHMSIPRFD